MRQRTVRTPDGVQWRLERRFVRPSVARPRWGGRRDFMPDGFDFLGNIPADGDVLGWLLVVVAVIAVVIVVIPLLLFGIELIIFGIVAAAVLVGSFAVAPRWLVRATNTHTGAVFEQQVSGRRACAAALGLLATEIRSGDEPIRSGPPVEHPESVPPPGSRA